MKPDVPALRGFGPIGVVAIFVIFLGALLGPPIAAILVFAWAYASGTPLWALGFRRPRSWPATIAGGVLIGAGLKLFSKTIFLPLLGAPPTNPRYAYLVGNTGALPGILLTVLLSAAIAEEVFYRGYLFERIQSAVRTPVLSGALALVVSTGLFAAAHLPDQGIPGAEQAALTGMVIGGLYLWSRQLWMAMIAHAAFDLTAVAIIYNGWEVPLAHAFLR